MSGHRRLVVGVVLCVACLAAGTALVPAALAAEEVSSSEVFSAPTSTSLPEGASPAEEPTAAQPASEPVAAESGVSGSRVLTPEEAGEFGPTGPASPSSEAASTSAPLEGSSSTSSMSLSSEPLSISGGEWLTGGEPVVSEEARRDSPEAVAKRQESQTKYEELNAEQAAKLAAERLPRVVNRSAGGPPSLAEGERIHAFPTANSAQLDLPGGKKGVLESSSPIAVPTSSTTFAPIDLSLSDAGSEFRSARSLVGTHIPRRLGEGISIPNLGVTLTPVDAVGHPLAGAEGSLDGVSALYANTQTDTDTLAKPTTGGFELDALLRSMRSPEQLYFAVGMPSGTKLESDGHGGALVMREGQPIAAVPAPAAADATGTVVPVQMSISGSTLVVTVKHPAGEYEDPIAVDPNVYDTSLPISWGANTNWHFHGEAESKFESYPSGEGVVMNERGGYTEKEHDELQYEAHGESSVMYIEEESSTGVSTVSGAVTKLEFAYGGTQENSRTLGNAGESYPRKMERLCVPAGPGTCGVGAINLDNEVRLMQTATKSGPEGYGFWAELFTADVGTRQEKGPEASYNTEATIAKASGRQNVLYGTNNWLSEHTGAFEAISKDPGLGVSELKIRDLAGGATWSFSESPLSLGYCAGVWCQRELTAYATYSPSMVDGNNTLETCATDAANMQSCANATVKVDNTKPSQIKLKGMAETGAELNATPHAVTVEATDQTSGIKSIAVSLDGKEIGTPTGACTPGECTASRAITLNGETLGAGEHHIVVTATDYGLNVLSKEYTFAIRNATPVRVGPGTVDPVTGQFALSASDVDVAGAGHVSRAYRSRELTAGIEGPLGPQWTLSLGVGQSIKILPNGNAELSTAGQTTTFASIGKGAFTSPKGDGNLSLEGKEKEGKIVEYLLKNPAAGTTTKFILPSGSRIWVPEITEGPAERDKVKYGYRTVEPTLGSPITEPTEILGPVPAGVTCGENPAKVKLEELKAGCRALTFVYAEKTTASGEGASEWGEYNGRLMQVLFTGTNPSSKASETITVAQYAYDKQGRLRAEWDPRIEKSGACGGSCSALKTEYGYDSEGHVTALTPPGVESWAFNYGAISADSSAGRLLKATRASASAGLWNGALPKNTAAPKLSGTPVVGVTMSVSNGTWENSPVAYSYKWQDCNVFGFECKVILGATNQSYKVASSDVGHTLMAQVSAINGGGTIGASSAISTAVQSTAQSIYPSFTQAVDSGNSLNAVSCVPNTTDCVVSDSKGNAFYATNVTASGAASWKAWTGPGTSPSEAVACPTTSLCLLAAGSNAGYGGNMYYATSLGGAWTLAFSPTYGVDAISCPSSSFCVDGQDEDYIRYSTEPASGYWYAEGQGTWVAMKGVSCLSSSFCAVADATGSVHVATSTAQIESETWTATKVDGTTALNGIACTSTTACVAVDSSGNVVNLAIASNGGATAAIHNIAGTSSLTAVTCTTGSTCVAVDNAGDVFISTNNGETWTKQYSFSAKLTSISCASQSLCVTADASGNTTAFDPSFTQAVDAGNSLNAVSCVPGTTTCVMSDSKGNAFYATNVSTSSAASWKAWTGPGTSPSEAVACPSSSLCLLAAGSLNGYGGNLYYASTLGGAWTLAYSPANGVDAISCSSSSFCVDGQDAYGYFRYSTNPASTSWELEDQGSATIKGATCLSSSFCALADSIGNVHVATTTTQVESSTWTETKVDGSTALNGIACTSTSSCIAIDGAGNIVNLAIASNGTASASKNNIDGTNNLTGVACYGSATCVAVDNAGGVFVSKDSGETWTKQYSLGDKPTAVSCASSSLCVAADNAGNETAFNPVGLVQQGTGTSAQPGFTVEYKVPVSGSGAPHQMTSSELAKWAQKKDLPVEATAIFPPDEPQGWPATDYKRAIINYLDTQARTVNKATPSGGISTVEYNALNEIERTLTADNRATALKEGCESELNCQSAKVAEALSTKKVYNSEGTELLETYAPEHKIRLSNGTEEGTRDRQQLSYNEGAPLGESHQLVTKRTTWAETATGKILAKHETITAYSGQKNLGWTLRKPTLVTTAIGGQTTTKAATYDAPTGNTVETTASISIGAPAYGVQFGQTGTKEGQLSGPSMAAVDKSSNVWVTDAANNRVEEFSATGAFIETIGFGVSNGENKYEVCTSSCRAGLAGVGGGEFSKPRGIAINQTSGNIYVVDQGNNRIEEFSAKSEFLRAFGKEGIKVGELLKPTSVAIAPTGAVWVADFGNNRIDEFSETGETPTSFGAAGEGNGQFKGPYGIAFSDGSAYVVDQGNNRVETFTLSGTYSSQFGSKGTGNGQFSVPYGISSDPESGDLYVTDGGNSRIEQFNPAGMFITAFGSKGKENGQLEAPEATAINAVGTIYVPDPGNNRVEEWEPLPAPPLYTAQFGSAGPEPGQLKEPRDIAMAKSGNVLVLDTANGRVQEFTPGGEYQAKFGSSGAGAGQLNGASAMAVDAKGNTWIADTGNNRVDEFNEKGEFISAFGFGVSTGEAKLQVCTTSCKAGISGAGSGQFKEPRGIAVSANGAIYVSDSGNNRLEEFTESGSFLAAFGFGVADEKAEYEICTSTCKTGMPGAGNGQFSAPGRMALSPNGTIWVIDNGNSRLEQFNEKDEYLTKFGTKGTGNGQLDEPADITITTGGNLIVTNTLNDRVEEFTPSGAFVVAFATKGSGTGQLETPEGIAAAPTGLLYVADTKNNRVQKWTSAPRPGNKGAQNIHTVYYSAGAEAEVATCQNHPEWAGLTCQSEPVAQPGVSGPPALPVTTTTYNMWDEPETVTEKIGSVTRTTKKLFDGAGRETSTEESATATEEAAIPTVTDEYSAALGVMEKQTETLEGKAKTVTNVFNTLGQLTSYTDAEGSTTKYAYDIDGRVEEVSEPQGKQVYTYDSTTGWLTKLVDSAAKTFTATYDVEGRIASATYPNGMTAYYVYNAIGQATSLEYIKTSGCSENCVWYKDTDAFGPGGELTYQASSLSTEAYQYNEDGQLTETQETPTNGKGCVTRLYEYGQESSERTSVTTRQPSGTGECATEGGQVEGHFYDTVGRLLDPGITYDALGNMKTVPASDAGGSSITSSFYVDNQVATQAQGGKSIAYSYDPTGRTMTTRVGTVTAIAHYAYTGDALTWTCEEEGKKECEEKTETKWSRNIPGIDETLDAIQTNGGTPILQLHDLQGNIVATAADNEAETKLLSTQNNTEFGVSSEGATPKYSWMGGEGFASELGTGVITDGGATYVPQLARTLQTEEIIPPGAAPNGMGSAAMYTTEESALAIESGNIAATNTVAEQRALEEEVCRQYLTTGCPDVEEDPSITLTGGEAEALGVALVVGPQAVEELSGQIPGLSGLILKILVELARKYAEPLGHYLYNCGYEVSATERASEGEKRSSGRCKLYGGLTLKLPFVYYGVEICFGVHRYKRKKKYHWTYQCSITFHGPV